MRNRNPGNATPIELDPPPCRLGHTKESTTHEPVKRQYSRFEVVKAPDVFECGSSIETETQRSHNLQQLQLMTLLPSSEPQMTPSQTPVPMQSSETDEVRSRIVDLISFSKVQMGLFSNICLLLLFAFFCCHTY